MQIIDRGAAADGSLYLVMDYLSGRSLSQYLNERPRGGASSAPDPSEALRLFLKIADAVNAAHLRGIVHRDLKPANIIIDDHGEPHILDFGLARTALVRYTDEPNPEPVTMTGQFLGSLPWSSPEQADGDVEKIDIRSDVYSLGVILYQMLTGEFPYEVSGTIRDVLNNVIAAEPPPPSQKLEARAAREAWRRMRLRIGPDRLNPIVDAIVLRALAKRQEERYQSAGELARDVADYPSGRLTLAAGEQPGSGSRRRWLIASSAAAAILVVIGAALLVRPDMTNRLVSDHAETGVAASAPASPWAGSAPPVSGPGGPNGAHPPPAPHGWPPPPPPEGWPPPSPHGYPPPPHDWPPPPPPHHAPTPPPDPGQMPDWAPPPEPSTAPTDSA